MACKREHAEFYTSVHDEMWMKIERAAAHSAAETVLAPEARFRDGVIDLDVARVLLVLERGKQIVQGGSRWLAEEGSPLVRRGNLVKVVDEMIRTGLARGLSDPQGPDRFLVTLTAAPVHLRSRTDRLSPLCEVAGPLRLRLVDHRDLADCPTCLA